MGLRERLEAVRNGLGDEPETRPSAPSARSDRDLVFVASTRASRDVYAGGFRGQVDASRSSKAALDAAGGNGSVYALDAPGGVNTGGGQVRFSTGVPGAHVQGRAGADGKIVERNERYVEMSGSTPIRSTRQGVNSRGTAGRGRPGGGERGTPPHSL